MSGEGWVGCLAMAAALALMAVGVGGLGRGAAKRSEARRQAASALQNEIAGLNSRALGLLDEIGMTASAAERTRLWRELRALDYEMASASVALHVEHGQELDPWNQQANLHGAMAEQQHAWEQMQEPRGKDLRRREGMI